MQTIKLNLIPGGVLPVVNVSQYDVGRHFAIQIYEGASSYDLAGKSVQIRGTKPDGNGFAYDSTDGVISVSGSTVTVSTVQQMTAVGGDTTVELRITASGVVLGTLNFVLMVEPSALSDDTPISDTDIPAIERDFQAALDEAEADALKAEGHAQGTQDGTPVGSGSPYYQNNAKYYKEQADTDATNAGNSATSAAADALKSEGYAVGKQNGTAVQSGSPYYQNNAEYYDTHASEQAYNASQSANSASGSATAANTDALKSEGFAVGEQGGVPVTSGSPYYHNNAEYYRDQAAQYAAGGLHFMASVSFASIPTTGMVNGDMYNITDAFTTDSRFVEGAGVSVAAGTNIAWLDSVSKWDIMAPGGGSGSLSGLSDVTITSATSDQILKFDGSKWVNGSDSLSKQSDVAINSPSDGNALVYDGIAGKWKNGTVSAVGDLDDLSDVDITTPSSGQFLKYDGAKWVNGTGGGGASALDDLTDVDITTPTDGQVLTYDANSQKWVNAAGGGGGGFSYKAWLQAANISPSGFADLAAVLADEETVRHLMTVHDSVDYLTGFAASDANIQTILNDNYAAKWINLRDYALDTLEYAFSAVMASAGKYGYGEWAYINNTWQPKGNVPIMTSNTAPYGVASAYQVFDGNSATTASATDFSYQFTNPVCPKSFDCLNTSGQTISGGTLQGSNDGSTWETPQAGAYYLHLRVHFASSTTVATVQFYGREMKVSVPVMTSNTAPYGVAFDGGQEIAGSNPAWKAFDGNLATQSNAWDRYKAGGNMFPCYVGYDFGHDVLIKFAVGYLRGDSATTYAPKTFKVQGYADNDYTDLTDTITNSNTSQGGIFIAQAINTNDVMCSKCRLYITDGYVAGEITVQELQFFGFDYSEYDWDADHPRHTLYDHGLVLETLDTTTCKSSGSTITFNSNDIEVYVESGSNKYAFILSNALVNLASYSNIFAKWGNKILSAGSATDFSSLNLFSQKPTDYASVGTYRESYAFSNIPLTDVILSLDVSSVSQNKYIGIGGRTATSFTYRLDEWWLE